MATKKVTVTLDGGQVARIRALIALELNDRASSSSLPELGKPEDT